MSNSSTFEPECAYPVEISTTRFILLSIASSLATIGFFCNSILTRIFMKGTLFEPALAMLALSDAFLCLCYVTIFGIEAAAYYLRVAFFYLAWFGYIQLMFPLGLSVLTAIPSLLILTMAQRCAVLMNKSNSFCRILRDSTNCGYIGLFLVSLACASRIPMFLSIEIHFYENCTEFFQSKQVYTSTSGLYPAYELFLSCVQVLIPFPILFTLNLTVVQKLRVKRRATQQTVEQLLHGSHNRARRNAAANIYGMINELTDDKKNEQNALISMVIVVCTYLVCNSLNLVLTAFEKWATHLVRDGSGWTDFSLVGKDIVSFLFTFCSVIRMPIYCRFNGDVRREVTRFVFNRCFSYKEKNRVLLRRTVRRTLSMRSVPFRSEEQTEKADRKNGVVML